MDWRTENGVWRSGPFTIELLGPERWLLTESAEDANRQVSNIREEWVGRSLSEMKARATRVVSDRRTASRRKRLGSVLVAALMLGAVVAELPTPFAGVLVLTAAGVFFVALAKLIDTFRKRPWALLRGHYQ